MADLFDYPTPSGTPTARPLWYVKPLKDSSGRVVQVRTVRTRPAWQLGLTFLAAGWDVTTFQAALDALRGGAVDAYFYTPGFWHWWADVAAGTGNGSALNFVFPGRDVKSQAAPVVKVAGSPVSSSTYAIEAAPGDSLARWRIAFTAGNAPAADAAVTVSFLGRRLLLGRLTSDPDESVPGYPRLSITLQLIGEEV